ncbi:uncharacterized protein LOC107028141 isoform X2 [Solanum pennellii]|uniref:Uncharacterized protein LOC107028141 isoform X2 n=1 Tax=Solanum pennellii TaxID=28526 RepID=A0ABM1HF62_SOLPN|nr:uncharacterized protein LOC107028141 isoform X2 [Solanum pennellii]
MKASSLFQVLLFFLAMACLQYGRNTLRQQLKNVKTSAAMFHKCEGGEVHLNHPLFYTAQGVRYRKLHVTVTTSIYTLGKAEQTVRHQRKIYQCEKVEEVKIVPAPKKDDMLVLSKHTKKSLAKVDSGRIISSDEPIGNDVTVAEIMAFVARQVDAFLSEADAGS